MKNTIFIKEMHCPSCEILMEQELKNITGISKIKANLKSKSVNIEYNGIEQTELLDNINHKINKYNYSATLENQKLNRNTKDLGKAVLIAIAIIVIFAFIEYSGFLNNFNIQSTSLPAVFFVGIIASLSSCAAVVGSLILSISATMEQQKMFTNKTIWFFHLSRLVSFFILGGLIGLVGKSLPINLQATVVMNSFLAVVMVLLGLNLIDIFQFSKKFQIRIPSFISKKLINKSESSKYSSILLGAVTFFLPCGFTQSMQIYALSTQDFIKAGITMLTFALGTFPILFLISISSKTFSNSKYSNLFFKSAGILVIAFGLYNLYNAATLLKLIF